MYPATIDSALGILTFNTAQKHELDDVIFILDEAAVWLNTKGIYQWFSPAPKSIWDLVEKEIEKSHAFLVRTQVDNYLVGTFRLSWIDPVWHDNNDAGYIYSLATRTHVKGYKVGVSIINWVKGYIKSNNRKYLRLDCIATNFVMRRYYEKLGFLALGQISQDGYTLALYELTL